MCCQLAETGQNMERSKEFGCGKGDLVLLHYMLHL